MSAIVRFGTTQVNVNEGDCIKVESIDAPVGEVLEIEDVLAVISGGNATFGRPLVEGAKVEAKVVRHGRAKKILVFKYKRRKRYRVTNGHRQNFTELEIGRILSPGAGEPDPAADDGKKETENGA